MAVTLRRNYNGWRKWKPIRSFVPDTINPEEQLPIPFGNFPTGYLPSSAFWGFSSSFNCCIVPPWAGTKAFDPYATFMLAGGGTFTLAGASAGLAAVSVLLQQGVQGIRYGLGLELPAITLGYCVGNQYREYVYFILNIYQRQSALGILLPETNTSKMDLFERSRLKRLYINHGEIRSYRVEEENGAKRYYLDIGMNGVVNSDVLLNFKPSGNITIKGATVKILSLKENWEIEISDPGTTTNSAGENVSVVFSSGDFYIFEKTWCIEDPFLMSGRWLGNENEYITGYPISGIGVHITDNNIMYDELSIVGIYVWEKDNEITYSNVPLNSTGNDGEWLWCKFKNRVSYIYGNREDRWVSFSSVASDVTTNSEINTLYGEVKEFNTGDAEDIVTWMKLSETTFVRAEINSGGGDKKNNWHTPILTLCWVKQENYYFKIIGQSNGNTIDISIKDVSGKVSFDIFSGFSILNQYAWMWNEIYGDLQTGLFRGNIYEKTYDSITNRSTLKVKVGNSFSEGLFRQGFPGIKYNPSYLGTNSFYNRIRSDSSSIISSTMQKAYDKTMNWLLVGENSGETYLIKTIDFSAFPTDPHAEYDMNLTVVGNASSETSEYVVFDTPYDRGVVKGASNSASSIRTGIFNEISPPFASNFGPNQTETICVSFEWMSSPIQESVSSGAMVGICGGNLWGSSTLGCNFVRSDNGATIWITTVPNKTSLSSFFNNMIEEDCVIYNDAISGNVTLRRGALGFRDNPCKTEVIIGGNTSSETVTSEIVLNQQKERVKSIIFDTPIDNSVTGGNALFIKVGDVSENNYYGFLVPGRGIVDLQTLRKTGVAAGTKPPSTYMYKSLISSPVYSYQRSTNNKLFNSTKIDLGIGTKEGQITIVNNNGTTINPKNVVIEYCEDKQTLYQPGEFSFFKMIDGENLLVYNQKVGEFKVDGKTNNSQDQDNLWDTPNAIFITGTGDESLRWGCPFIKELTSDARLFNNEATEISNRLIDSDFRFPLMVLPACEYLGGIYQEISNSLFLFARCYINNTISYLGCFIFSVADLVNDLYKCNETDPKKLPYLFRVPGLDDIDLSDDTVNYANAASVISNLPISNSGIKNDFFIRVMGDAKTNSEITTSDFPTIVSPFIMEDGTLGALYDGGEGIRLIYSRDGKKWNRSDIIIAKDASCPLYIDGTVIAYIGDSGIVVKLDHDLNTHAAMNLGDADSQAGNYDALRESIQKDYDGLNTALIGSGDIPLQRITGYKTAEGIYKIFYYDSEGLLSCAESQDQKRWSVAPNF